MDGRQFSPDTSLMFGGLTSILQLDGIFSLLSKPSAEVLVLVVNVSFNDDPTTLVEQHQSTKSLYLNQK